MKRATLGLAVLAMTATSGCETAGELLVSSTMSGDWKGTAYCAYGVPIEMTLTLEYWPGGAATATNALKMKGNVGELEIATYTLLRTYDVETYKLSLEPVSWVSGIAATTPGATMVPIETELEPSSRTMKIAPSKGCSGFELSK